MDIAPSTLALACAYGLGMLFFTVAFLVDCIRLRRYLREYLAIGLVVAAITVASDAPAVIIADLTGSRSLGICCLVGDVWVFVRVLVIVMLGMHYAAVMRRPSFALLAWLRQEKGWPMGSRRTAVDPSLPLQEPITPQLGSPAFEEMAGEASPPQSDVPAEPWWAFSPLHESGWRAYLVDTTAVLLGMLAYSVALFLLTRPTIGVPLALSQMAPLGADVAVVAMTVFVAIAYGFSEEVFFRLGIQGWLGRYMGKGLRPGRLRRWLPIVLSSLLWTVGHAGTLEPEWVKLAQILPAGLALGWLYERRGAESTITVHVVFNLVMVLLSSWLIS
jgi:membrane protease YdiL (CAAX protease family)